VPGLAREAFQEEARSGCNDLVVVVIALAVLYEPVLLHVLPLGLEQSLCASTHASPRSRRSRPRNCCLAADCCGVSADVLTGNVMIEAPRPATSTIGRPRPPWDHATGAGGITSEEWKVTRLARQRRDGPCRRHRHYDGKLRRCRGYGTQLSHRSGRNHASPRRHVMEAWEIADIAALQAQLYG
jgi:hypothetical protein